jgi:chaperonin GroES
MHSVSSEDLYDVVGKIERRLIRLVRDAWRRENEIRCGKIWREFRPMPTMFHPLADRVLIKPEATGGEKLSPSGLIVIPDMGKTRATIGFVLAVGPDCDEQLEIGDKVLFGKYAGSDITLNDEELVICRLDDVLGIITEEPDEDPIDQGSSEPDPPA